MGNRPGRLVVLLSVAALMATSSVTVVPAVAAPPAAVTPAVPPGADLEVYTGDVDSAGLQAMRDSGVDAADLTGAAAGAAGTDLEVVLSKAQATKLRKAGVVLKVKMVNGVPASAALRAQAAAGWQAFRPYGAPGGIKDEIYAAGGAHPDIAKVVRVGRTVQGQEILALKVTKDATRIRDGRRPSVLYVSDQHAREWITPEMTRRLMHYMLDGYGKNKDITALLDTTELWFLPVANPDGYDFTFTAGNRLWRKNLRDNNGDGAITVGDGVDLNRNFAVKWGYDNEGSSPDPADETYRGPGPNSEPETKALDALFRRVRFDFFVNYHSAAQLLLHGIGWQVSTPSPDDVIYESMVGTDSKPAVPGYDPDISAELYTTNGDTDTHAQVKYGTLGFTPEMSTCQAAANSVPDDQWEADDCISEFIFPDDENLIQAEFEKNIPFALSVAKSAKDPDDPVSSVGLDTPDLVADPFTVSYGRTQQVAVTAKRSLQNLHLVYSVNGGRPRIAPVKEWKGGERYGDTNNDYYAEFRGTIRANPGDKVHVLFIGRNSGPHGGSAVHSKPFSYSVAKDIGGDVLILAAEDTTGISPAQNLPSAQFADEYAASLAAAGYSSDVYDFDLSGRKAPHPLGVLSHYKAVVWETGNDIILRNADQVGGTTAKAALDIELSVRDYLNEGGKLLAAGKYNQYAQAADGAYFYNPFEPPECTTPDQYPCLPLFNDFQQYWLGAYANVDDAGTDSSGEPFGLIGAEGPFAGFTGDLNAAGSAANQDHTGLMVTTSSFLPAQQFPQFTSAAPLDWDIPGGPFDPHAGAWYVYSGRADLTYKRLTRTVDLTAATSGELSFWTSFDTEADWDFMFVEAHTVGSDNWTTLPDANGKTQTGTGDSCEGGWVQQLHPFLGHYMNEQCEPTGSTGVWNAATGSSQGWKQWSSDLSGYAGQQVEVSISYASDWGTQGTGVFLDDVTVLADGSPVAQTGFESDLAGWTVAGSPDGSVTNSNDWSRSQLGFEEGAIATTPDTIYAGFGYEGLAPGERDDLVARSMRYLLPSS